VQLQSVKTIALGINMFEYRKNRAKAYKLHARMHSMIGISLSTAQTFLFTLNASTVNKAAMARDTETIIMPDIKKAFCLDSVSKTHLAA